MPNGSPTRSRPEQCRSTRSTTIPQLRSAVSSKRGSAGRTACMASSRTWNTSRFPEHIEQARQDYEKSGGRQDQASRCVLGGHQAGGVGAGRRGARGADSPRPVMRDQAALSTAQFFALWQVLVELSGDPAIGLRIATGLEGAVMPPSFMAAYHARDFRDALQRVARFKRLCAPEEVRIEEREDRC